MSLNKKFLPFISAISLTPWLLSANLTQPAEQHTANLVRNCDGVVERGSKNLHNIRDGRIIFRAHAHARARARARISNG